ncbi:peroxidase-related enzyme [Rhodocaloribacter litoris]|uniref:carboxymuconolactone decarboxylase family protein n=1 Tax=Rhodocaloribacter litoris TaxID=2558931 RepID=UPI00142383A4|nr:peroxidase-related enzyme [Rhodocaloribacter litoris]QXD13759.1 peroxidase-related enzyme [Rhodocaloribacter litoris]
MAHVSLPEGLPGIVGLLEQFPGTGRHLRALAQELLRGPSSLSPGERELIAAYVSSENDCFFCMHSHGAAARHLLGDRAGVVEQVRADFEGADVSEKLKALLRIAKKVQLGGRQVTAEDVARARAEGATDEELHHTVLIAAAFCMYNRYVDGLATWTPEDPGLYDQQGARLAAQGYL